MLLGESIRVARLQAGLTQEQVCNAAQITQGFYSGIENGKNTPSLDALERISNALDLPLLWIVCKAFEKKDLPRSKRSIYNELQSSIDEVLQIITPA